MYCNSDMLELRAEDSRSKRWIIAKEFRVFQGHNSWYYKGCCKIK